jgi:predicted transcriptional regulator
VTRIFRLTRSSWTKLGPTEWRSLNAVWARGSATVREVLRDLSPDTKYTTVMTTLVRLYKKGLLSRELEDRAFRYKPCFTREEVQLATAKEWIRTLLDLVVPGTLPLAYLVDALSEHDIRLIDELHRIVEQKRHEQSNRQNNDAAINDAR